MIKMEKSNEFFLIKNSSTIKVLKTRDDILNDENYKKLYDSFYSLFIRHGHIKKDIFDNEIWFIKNSNFFKDILQTPTEPHKLLEILSELNEVIKNENLKNNFEFKINVDEFIYKISEALIDLNRVIIRSKENIKKYNLDDETNLIPVTLEMLKKRIDIKNIKNFSKTSKANFSILKMENFPNGEYDIQINIKEINLKNYNQNELCLKPIEKFGKNLIEKDKIITMKKFTEYEFKFCDEEKYYLYPFSGTTLLTYQIICKKLDEKLKNSTKVFKSGVKPFLDFLLMNTSEVRNLMKETITKSSLIKIKNEEDDEEYLINLDLSIQLDDRTRWGILNRLNSLFKEVLMIKSENENKIDQLIHFFPELENELKSILEMKYGGDEKKPHCCECIII